MNNRTEIESLRKQINVVISSLPWLDESFEKKLKPLSEEEAFRKPNEQVHTVAENLSHLTEWRFEILRRFEQGKRTMEVDDPRNWIPNEELRKKGWQSLKDNFHRSQSELEEYLSDKDDGWLNTPYYHVDFRYLLEGILHHDLYHLGQIGLVIKMNSLQA